MGHNSIADKEDRFPPGTYLSVPLENRRLDQVSGLKMDFSRVQASAGVCFQIMQLHFYLFQVLGGLSKFSLKKNREYFCR